MKKRDLDRPFVYIIESQLSNHLAEENSLTAAIKACSLWENLLIWNTTLKHGSADFNVQDAGEC